VYIFSVLISAVLAALFYYRTKPDIAWRQRLILAGLRFIVFLTLFLFLLTPLIYYIKRHKERPVVILLKDNSASMQIDHQGKPKSASQEQSYLALSKAYKQAGYTVKEQIFADGLGGAKNTTFLLPALAKLRTSSDKAPIKGIFVFSDGWFRDSDLNVIKGFDLPIFTVADTSISLNSDLQIVDLRHNRQGYRNELSMFEADVKSIGFKGTAQVQFLMDAKIIKEKTISFQKELVQTVAFDYRFPKVGLHKIEVKIKSTGLNELTLSNNQYSSAIDILNDKEKILLLTDAPNWDNKFILDAISENNRWQTQSITVKGKELFLGEQKTVINNLDNVSVIIIINQGTIVPDNSLTQSIVSKVNQGSGLLLCGLPIPQLNDILPLRQSNIRSQYQGLFKLLPAAGGYSAFQIPDEELSQIPPVDYFYVAPSAQAEILATMDNAQKSPAIAITNQSNGKVVSFSFLNLWRWQMQSQSLVYRNFITNLIVWLSNKSSGQLSAQYQPSYFMGEPIEIKLTALDEIHKLKLNLAPRISVFNARGDSVFSDFMVMDNDNYKIQFRLNEPSDYQFKIKDQVSGQSVQGRFVLQSQNQESRDLGYNLPVLSWVAVQTGGRFLNLVEAAKLKPLEAVETDRTEKREFPLYKKWYLISLFIVLFCLELFLRRRWGLL
jgi:hypothetical protein